MNKNDHYYKILNNAKTADEPTVCNQMKTFVNYFVVKNKKARWKELFCKSSGNLYKKSHKLEEDLNKKHCTLTNELEDKITNKMGIYYDFLGSAVYVEGHHAVELGVNNDAIFLINLGKNALVFSHEGRIWICEKQNNRRQTQ